ncbi:hypothetical protein SLA2020_369380 [Shorea laevis]
MKTCFAKNVFFFGLYMAIAFSPLACGDGCSKEQNTALLEIRNSTNGLAFAGWNGSDCCQADGIYVTVEMGELATSIIWRRAIKYMVSKCNLVHLI